MGDVISYFHFIVGSCFSNVKLCCFCLLFPLHVNMLFFCLWAVCAFVPRLAAREHPAADAEGVAYGAS